MKNEIEKMVGIGELSRYLDIKVNTVYAWVHSRQIPYYKVGRLVKFRKSEIDQWLEQRKVKEIAI